MWYLENVKLQDKIVDKSQFTIKYPQKFENKNAFVHILCIIVSGFTDFLSIFILCFCVYN